MSGGQCRIQLRRANAATPWGFRLQGGLDVNSRLVVQRVFSGTPADGQLQRGDVLLAIDSHDVTNEYIKKAEELIKSTGHVVTLLLNRSPGNGPDLSVQQQQQQQFAPRVQAQSQPVNRSYEASPAQSKPHPPSSFGTAHFDGSPSGPSRAAGKANVWSPGPSYSQPAVSAPSRQPTSPPQTSYQQERVIPIQHEGYGAPRGGGAPWQAQPQPGGGGGAGGSGGWNQPVAARGGQSAPGHVMSPTTAAPRQPPADYSYGDVEDGRQVPVSTQSAGQQADDEDYEPKSVRDIKAMFNKPSPSPAGPPRRSGKPRPGPGGVSSSQPTWSTLPSSKPKSVSQFGTYSPPAPQQPSYPAAGQGGRFVRDYSYPDSVEDRPSLLQPATPSTPVTRLLTATTNVATPKKSTYGYQGIVTVTPAKQVHKPASGGSGKKEKKEFDPTKSLVLQMLQEETDRAKYGGGRGGAGEEEQQEEPAWRPAAPPARPPPQQPQRQRAAESTGQSQSSRLQELLDRDQASAQQFELNRQQQQQQQQQQQRQQQAMSPQQSYQQQQQAQYSQRGPEVPRQRAQPQRAAAAAPGFYGQQQSDDYYQQDLPRSYYQGAPGQGGGGGYQHAYNGGDSVPISDF